MFLAIKDFLTPEEVARLRELSLKVQFVDGRISNPHNKAKNNLQANESDPGYVESSRIVGAAFARSEPFRDFAFPEVQQALGLTLAETDLFSGVPALDLPAEFSERMRSDIALALAINTEKARSEFIIAPVLSELRRLLGGRFGLFSGVEFDVDASRGLKDAAGVEPLKTAFVLAWMCTGCRRSHARAPSASASRDQTAISAGLSGVCDAWTLRW